MALPAVNNVVPALAPGAFSPGTWARAVHEFGQAAQGLGGAALSGAGSQLRPVYACVTEAAAGYAEGLASACSRIVNRRSPGASRQELVCIAEFQSWLGELPPHWGRSLATAVPEDILSYMDGHWVHKHGRTVVKDVDHCMSSFTGAKGALLHLEHYFEVAGRSGEWQPFTGVGNPCRSSQVRSWRVGYERFLWGSGVEPAAAVPAKQADTLALASSCFAAGAGAPHVSDTTTDTAAHRAAVAYAVQLRNAMVMHYDYASSQRGGEVRTLLMALSQWQIVP